MKNQRLWIAIAFLVVAVSCTGRPADDRPRATRPAPTVTPTTAPTPSPTPALSDTIAFQTQCYPVPSVLSSRADQWVDDNCSTFTATYLSHYKDDYGKVIFRTLINGKRYDIRPVSLRSFPPTVVLERGDDLGIRFDGAFQNRNVSFVMMYRKDRLDDKDFMVTVREWNPDYIHMNGIK